MSGWKVFVDCGGTFTDLVATNGSGDLRTHKLLSHSPHYQSAVVEGIRQLFSGVTDFSIERDLTEVRLGTTVATNAFLERKGVDCGLITTVGFKDLLLIRQQNRPKLFELTQQAIEPLYKAVTQVEERIDSQGRVLVELDREIAEFELQRLFDQGLRSLAISLMNSTKNPMHECQLGEWAERIGFQHVVLSHKVSPIANYISRTETAVVDAYLTPYLRQYTGQLQEQLGVRSMSYMQSSGVLTRAEDLTGSKALLSGPAGGVAAANRLAKPGQKFITFDMGGTSTDVAICSGEMMLEGQPHFNGYQLLTPMVDIHTVAAGGGSVIEFDGVKFDVGPESAGADPGPACYGRGGPLTVTDANLFLGRIHSDHFANQFGPNRDQPLNKEVVVTKFSQLALDSGLSPKEVAEGCLRIANEKMVNAIKKNTIEKGYDPKDYTLLSFGGAGGQVALKVAEELQIEKVYVHPLSSILSAYGMGCAPLAWSRQTRSLEQVNAIKGQIETEVRSQGEQRDLQWQYEFRMHLPGSDYFKGVIADSFENAQSRFLEDHQRIFRWSPSQAPVCDSVKVIAKVVEPLPQLKNRAKRDPIEGPCIEHVLNSSVVIEEGWASSQDSIGGLEIHKVAEGSDQKTYQSSVELELFYQKIQFIAEQMGIVLKRTAQSVNIKERNDFSCAIFAVNGDLLANAPHIPVHLGSMSDSVRAVASEFNEVKKGDSFLLNDPMKGGTHLPDLTVVTPVFLNDQHVAWVASRGHHADVGGVTPGSMPSESIALEQEGVVIAPTRVSENGLLNTEKLREILSKGPYPVRNFQLCVDDIQAQLAANHIGEAELADWMSEKGLSYFTLMSESLLNYSDQCVQKIIPLVEGGEAQIRETEGREIFVEVKKSGQKLTLDFSRCSPCGEHNFHAPLPVLRSAVLFVIRSLVDKSIPLNDGLMRSVEVITADHTLVSPNSSSAVVAGNVETSQSLVDALFMALRKKACGQGTMNNLSFGNHNFQYYETIAGGDGATASHSGTSALQVAMTNSLMTDPEVLEERLPVQVELMAIRHGSGGKGKYNGGDGAYRRLLLNEAVELSVISQRRLLPPQGMDGGGDGLVGRNWVESTNGWEVVPACFTEKLQEGSRVSIESPGGGGWGLTTDEENRELVFSFGSNMDEVQIKQRCPSSKLITRAVLPGYQLRYTRYSNKRKGGVADIFRANGHYVYGVLISMTKEDLLSLDQIECGDRGYRRIQTHVYDDNGSAYKCFAYDVIDKNPDVPPTKIYEWLVYSGALQINAPKFYLDAIRSFRAKTARSLKDSK